MATLESELELSRCPHCGVDRPSLQERAAFWTEDYTGKVQRIWKTYACRRCGGVVTAWSTSVGGLVYAVYPDISDVNQSIPARAKDYLKQAMDSLHAPAGSVILSASGIDAMLKTKGLKDGSLYSRIEQAAEDHLITPEMAQWAHEVRLDANDQRHADENAQLPSTDDAKKCLDFALALGEFLFVLPARVNRGLVEATQTSN